MLAEIKKYADKRDMKGLRYIFVDCLDVDPTFEKYRADYEYCKSMDGFFESYNELHGIVSDQGKWNMQYWEQLKLDLMKNFSEKRFEHMIKVAKVVYAAKIERLLSERESKSLDVINKSSQAETHRQLNESAKTRKTVDTTKKMTKTEIQEMQEKQLEAKKKALEIENQRIEAEQKAKMEEIEAKKKANRKGQVASSGVDSSKKGMGIVLVIVAVIVVGTVIGILH